MDGYRGLSFGEEFHLLRRKRGMTLGEVAERAGLAVGLVSEVERNLRVASPRTANALVGLLGRGPEAGRLAALAAHESRRIELDLAGLDADRIDVLIRLRSRFADVPSEAVATIRALLEPAAPA